MTKYSYKYDLDKLESSKEISYTIMFGQIVDSMITVTNYEYDNDGLLKKEISKSDFEETPSLVLYDYNSNDSLMSKFKISSEGDTTLWDKYEYFPDGKKTVFQRILTRKIDFNQDFVKSMADKKLDTIQTVNEYKYENGLCKSMTEFDSRANPINKVEYDYDNDRIQKATFISFHSSMELTEKIMYYNYSKSKTQPDFYSLDLNKDTVDLCINEFDNQDIVLKTEVFNYGQFGNKTFYENGKEIGLISIDKNASFKMTESYSYFENGDLKETKSYHEELKNTL
ncbi:hypothetical protein [Maribellus maritimus]|uniref:hypothetical protein n=1 Tax=Maribellus maritimus TaxID=2870838 RepID=UPI001EECB436|nr:hypothetical protein [Maribellus maritimus]MCG6191492.1 hypothetical protein [Maribellus maritimus]